MHFCLGNPVELPLLALGHAAFFAQTNLRTRVVRSGCSSLDCAAHAPRAKGVLLSRS